ncbi:DnaJ C-terminal domain-containing protein [Candidatus Venteria ishoeyi]|uniref:Curved DNA-binding protein n=1 Tax=Candidatus Venteria ishoeyi TaxID=1899563 RepID=A0A1H6FEF4_9GAMM|nr:DnaJ C-terminal domain-containing protein [Candidatus Venteria ishoeyi]MDM8546251.1 DnaJ C-terminal domain-containing protein [Candidatus Venteria ishoeyi]SEH07405.1 Curved DNA-binding protein [Candidatus Venteria ishoeyi]
MEYKDYYKIMGVPRDVTQDALKKSYRKLARKYHPDVSKEANAEQKFKEIGEAYEVLKDPEKRAAYEQLGSQWRAGEQFKPPPNWDSGFEFSGRGGAGTGAGFSDFFESFFGQRSGFSGHTGSQGFPQKGEDHHAKILISLEDAYSGASRAIQLNLPATNAQGHLRSQKRTLNIKIPKGVIAGQKIRLTGQGGPGRHGARAGDLYLEIAFEEHPLYRIEARDLHLDLPITPWEAALGGRIEIPTPGGTLGIKIPAGSQSGKKMRLKGRGLPGKISGDLYLILQIFTPPADNETAQQFYQTMANSLPLDPRESFFS